MKLTYLLQSRVIAAALFVVGCAVISLSVGNAQVWKWSQTSATNATADPSINWSIGMAPSGVSPSARAMMSGIAKWRDDLSGLLVDTGTASAYVVTSNQGLATTPNNGQEIDFVPANTNAASVTLTVDSGNTYPIQTSPGSAVSAGVLIAGTPYALVFNSSTPAWILKGFFVNPSTTNVPLGTVLDYTGTTAPNSSFVLAYGQCISRATYAAYFSLVGSTFSSCDGVTTFGVPDLRGALTAGIDNMGGTPKGNITTGGSGINGQVLGATGGAQNQTMTQANLPNVNFSISGTALAGGNTVLNSTTATFVSGGSGSTGGNSTGSAKNVLNNVTVTQGTAASGGSGTPLTTMPPTFMLNKIVRVL